MSEQENTRLVQQAYDGFKTGNIQALLDTLSKEVEWQLPDIENVPFSGTRRGREQVGEFFAEVDKQQEVLEFELKEFIAQNDKVVVLGHYSWRVKSTGRKLAANWVHIFTVRGGNIARFQEFTDTAAAAAAYRKS